MTHQETHSHVQAFRRVDENGHSSTLSNIIHLVCHPDPSVSGKDIVLWDDILAVFQNALYVRSGTIALPFLKGPNFKNLDPLRIAAIPGATLDVVVKIQSTEKEQLSLESFQKASPDATQQNNNTSPRSNSASTITNTVTTKPRRNPAAGLVEVAMDAYRNNDNPAFGPQPRGPQEILEDSSLLPPSSPPSPASNASLKMTQNANSNTQASPPMDTIMPPSSSTREFTQTMRSAILGNKKDAQVSLGDMYKDGSQGVTLDYHQAMKYYLKAAERGDPVGQRKVGALYYHGLGVKQDFQAAMKWYRKAADQGDAIAQCKIGTLYRNGEGVAQDYRQAIDWFYKAAEKNLATAQNKIGAMYQEGLGLSKNNGQAMYWFRQAADQGYANAQINVGYMYQFGVGVSQDYPQAMQWYQKAAAQGSAEAQHTVGYLFDRVRGVPRDFAQAMIWYRKAADQGHVDAMYGAGLMYLEGRGVPVDREKAYTWLRKAAELGQEQAQRIVLQLYPDGVVESVDKYKKQW
ncbi:hypothetical protein BGZ95_009249 [Linnemannia exigua]|uniref:HCP-like protein n=1 Tax=Linnemannia exigua TaxID=604196 RepID=A0AAD4DDR1_9FUNG|nr:hypothetical protein BGZ95_009249 [Linnemannia exigua]